MDTRELSVHDLSVPDVRQAGSEDDLMRELLAEVHAIEADIQAAQDAADRIDGLRAQIEATCQDAAALPPDDLGRVRDAALARLRDHRVQIAHAELVRRNAAARVAQAADRMRAVRRIVEQLLALDETA
jgi:hypothetical protein